jgi:predicted phage-related endonuclease
MTPEQLAERRKGIGASDARKIVDGEWYDLWMEKTGRKEAEDLSTVWPVQLGKCTEDLNLAWYTVKTGRPVSRQQEVIVSDEYPFMRCTLDGADMSVPALIECKHVNSFSKLPDVVERYTPQVLHQMGVAQVPHAYLSIIVGSNEPVLVEVEWDQFWFDDYADRCALFWGYVERDEEPSGAPPPLAPPMPIDKMRTVDFTGNNQWADFATDWLYDRDAAKRFANAEKGLKGMVEADVRLATGHGVKISRDGRGLKVQGEKS